jgi:hypothetical protein
MNQLEVGVLVFLCSCLVFWGGTQTVQLSGTDSLQLVRFLVAVLCPVAAIFGCVEKGVFSFLLFLLLLKAYALGHFVLVFCSVAPSSFLKRLGV